MIADPALTIGGPALSASRRETASPVWPALLTAALGELLAERVFGRMLVYLPKDKATLAISSTLTAIGPFMVNLVVILSVLALVMVPPPIWKPAERGRPRLLQAIRLLSPVAGLVSLAVACPLTSWSFQAAAVGFVLALLVGSVTGREQFGLRAFLVLTGLSFLCAEGYLVAGQLGSASGRALAIPLFYIGEALAVAAVISLGLGYLCRQAESRERERVRWWPLAALLPVVVLVGWAFFSAPSQMSQVALFGLGFTVYLPFPLYLLALVIFCTVSFSLVGRTGPSRQLGIGLLIVAIAGYAPQMAAHRLLLWLAGLSAVLAARPAATRWSNPSLSEALSKGE